MALDLDIVGSTFEPIERSWTSTDCLLYALGVGAGTLGPDRELEFTTENSIDRPQQVLPTFAAVLGVGAPPRERLGTFDPAMLLHGEQGIDLVGPIPPVGTVRTTATVTGIHDKGSGAVVVTESTSVDVATGRPAWKTTNALFIRGERGIRRVTQCHVRGSVTSCRPARPHGHLRHSGRSGPPLPTLG